MVEGTEEQEIKKLISFFEILGAENVSEGIINQLYNFEEKKVKGIRYIRLIFKKKVYKKLDA